MKRVMTIGLCGVCLGSIPALAHHSLAPYNMSTYRTVDGTVKTFEWTNPHAKIILAVAAQDGSKEWNFEGSGTARLISGGFVKDTIRSGDKITVAYSPKRDQSIGGFFIAVTTADGTTYATDRFKQLKGASSSER